VARQGGVLIRRDAGKELSIGKCRQLVKVKKVNK
jgi:hypothetical protein